MIRANGFTLIELLAAMAVASLLLMSLAWVTGTIGREIRQSPKDREAEEIWALSTTFERLVQSALPTAPGVPPLEIASDHLSGLIAPPAALGPVGPIKMTMNARQDAGRVALYVKFEAEDRARPLPPIALTPIKLLSDARSIEFNADEKVGRGSVQLVHLTVKGIETRTLSAVTKVTSTGACRFDAISGTCR